MSPLTVAIAHSKGGVGKTTTTIILGKFLARDYRVLLKDYDDTRQLTDLVRSLGGEEERVSRQLRLAGDVANSHARGRVARTWC